MPCEHRILEDPKYMGVQRGSKSVQGKLAMSKTG